MQRVRLVALGWLAVVMIAGSATAASNTYFDKTVTALKVSAVYVDPATPGTDSDTSGVLTGLLTPKDNIIIVVLPEEAAAETQENIDEFVRRLDAATKHKWIIGLAIGDKEVGFTTKLPAGVASEQMRRAQNVTQFTLETLRTFISNIHDWQHDNPQATPEPQIKPHSKKSGGLGLWWILILGGATAFIVVVISAIRSSSTDDPNEVKFKASPDPVKEELEKLSRWPESVGLSTLNSTIVQICRDTEEFFRRFGRDGEDTKTFRGHLLNVNKVLEKYVDIQDNPRYYDDPAGLMKSGQEAVEGFAALVLDSIKRGNKRQLTDFNVDTDILSAQKYKYV